MYSQRNLRIRSHSINSFIHYPSTVSSCGLGGLDGEEGAAAAETLNDGEDPLAKVSPKLFSSCFGYLLLMEQIMRRRKNLN